MKKSKSILCAAFGLALVNLAHGLPAHAFSGGETGGGGVTAEQNGHRRLLDLIEQEELTYFFPETVLQKASSSGLSHLLFCLESATHSLIDWPSHYHWEKGRGYVYDREPKPQTNPNSILGSTSFVMTMIMSYDQYGTSLWDPRPYDVSMKYTDKLLADLKVKKVLPLKWAFTGQPLELLNDEGVIYIENPKSRRQLAIQKNGLVVINKTEFDLLDDASKEGLFLHESVLRAVLLLNPKHIEQNGTTYVRKYVRAVMRFWANRNDVPLFTVTNAFQAFGIVE